MNIITADDVQGTITIRMRNVPWDQALDVILQAKGLGMVRQGNLIRVAPLAVLQKERDLELARHKQELDLAPLETRLIPVSYATAEELQARAQATSFRPAGPSPSTRAPTCSSRATSRATSTTSRSSSAPSTRRRPRSSSRRASSRPRASTTRDVGIQWGGDATFSEATGNPTGVAFPSRLGLSGGNYDQTTPTAGLSPFTRTLPNAELRRQPSRRGRHGLRRRARLHARLDRQQHQLDVRLSAAESSGMVRI